jgi:hypothetical protein
MAASTSDVTITVFSASSPLSASTAKVPKRPAAIPE